MLEVPTATAVVGTGRNICWLSAFVSSCLLAWFLEQTRLWGPTILSKQHQDSPGPKVGRPFVESVSTSTGHPDVISCGAESCLVAEPVSPLTQIHPASGQQMHQSANFWCDDLMPGSLNEFYSHTHKKLLEICNRHPHTSEGESRFPGGFTASFLGASP